MATQQTPVTPVVTNIKTSFQLASAIAQLRETTTLNDLLYTSEVMSAIKKIPKITQAPKTIKLSDIIPETQEEEPETITPQEKPSFLTRARSKVRGKKRTH